MYTIVRVSEDRWMAGEPSPDVFLVWFGGFEVGWQEAQGGTIREYKVNPAWTSAAGLFSSRGVSQSSLPAGSGRETPQKEPPTQANWAAGQLARPVASLQPKHR